MRKIALIGGLSVLLASLSIAATPNTASTIWLGVDITIAPNHSTTISLDKLPKGIDYHISCMAAGDKPDSSPDKDHMDVAARFEVTVAAPGRLGDLQYRNDSLPPPVAEVKLTNHPFYSNMDANHVTLFADGNTFNIKNLDKTYNVRVAFCQATPVLS